MARDPKGHRAAVDPRVLAPQQISVVLLVDHVSRELDRLDGDLKG